MESVEYDEELTRDKLKHLKNDISSCGFKFDYEKSLDVDTIFVKKINGLLNDMEYSNDIKSMIETSIYNKKNDVYTVLAMYYFALYNDSVDTLSHLIKNGIKLKNKVFQFELFSIDRSFTCHFKDYELIYLMNGYRDVLSNFYKKCFLSVKTNLVGSRRTVLIGRLKSLNELLFLNSDLSLEEIKKIKKEIKVLSLELKSSYKNEYDDNERYILTEKFANIMRKNPNICKSKNKVNMLGDFYHNLLVPEVIKVFDEDMLLKLGDKQKYIINNCLVERDYDSIKRLKTILDKNINYNNIIPLTIGVRSNFTNEELFKMTEYEMKLYKLADEIGEIPRVKYLYSKGVIFMGNGIPLCKEIFLALDDNDIINITSKNITKINELFKRYSLNVDKSKIIDEIRKVVQKNSIVEKVKKLIS